MKSYPPWAKDLEVELGLGRTLITFTASSPVSDEIGKSIFMPTLLWNQISYTDQSIAEQFALDERIIL